MEFILSFIDIFLHLDKHLNGIIQNCGNWTYLILFLIIFCETGLVITPMLPGDSLLFAVGAFAAIGSLKITWLFVLLSLAAILGDTLNYWIGYFIGPKIFHKENVRFLKKEYLIRTHKFYEKYGGITIIIARFMPIIRTFAPFVAGIGTMSYWRFISYNIIGGISWIAVFTFGGYFFGNIPFVKRNFTLVIFTIIFISILPGIIGFLKHKLQKKNNMSQDEIKKILAVSKTIAVVGLSPDEQKASNGVAQYLKEQGYVIIPVNPNYSEVLGEKCYASLLEIPHEIDIVDIFRRSEFVPLIVEEAIKKKAKIIWMQEGIVNSEAEKNAVKAGLKVVMDKCILKEHSQITI